MITAPEHDEVDWPEAVEPDLLRRVFAEVIGLAVERLPEGETRRRAIGALMVAEANVRAALARRRMNQKGRTMAKQSTLKPAPPTSVEAAEKTIAKLERQRAELVAQASEADAEVQRTAYSAHALGDVDAGRRLGELREAVIRRDQRLREIDAAIATAKTVLAEAQQAEQRAQAKQVAREILKHADDLVGLAEACDSANEVRNGALHELADKLTQLNELARGLAFEKIFTAPENLELAKRERAENNPLNVLVVEKSGGDAYNELQDLAKELRKREPQLTESQAFTKVLEAPENRELVLREREESAPPMLMPASKVSLSPTYVGGPAALHEGVSNTEQSEAYEHLVSMAEKLRESSPWLSTAQAFERALTNSANRKLAQSALARPTASSPGRQ